MNKRKVDDARPKEICDAGAVTRRITIGEHGKPWSVEMALKKAATLANSWDYRIQHIQNLCKIQREFKPRALRNLNRNCGTKWDAPVMWLVGLRAVQTFTLQRRASAARSEWEEAATRVYAAINTGNKVRRWKKRSFL